MPAPQAIQSDTREPANAGAARLPTRWAQPGTWLALVAVAVIALGVLHRDAVVLALGATLLALVCLAYLWAWRAIRGIRVERSFRDRLFVDEPLLLTWRVRYRALVPLAYPRMNESAGVQRGPAVYGRLPLGMRLAVRELGLTFESERGRGHFDVGPGYVEGGDPLGLFRLKRAVPAQPGAVRVYPRPFPGELPFMGASPLQITNLRNQFLAGADLDFSGTREYQSGDNPRRIHWRATARQQQLIISEYDRIIRTDLTVILDLSAEARLGTGSHSTSEFAIRIAGTLVAHGLSRGHRAQVIAAQGHQLVTTGLGYGQTHLLRVFDQLALWRPTAELTFARLIELATRGRRLPLGGVCVLVAPSRILLLEDVGKTFAQLEQTQLALGALALQEQQFHALTATQQLRAAEVEQAKQTAGNLVIRGVEVRFVDTAPQRKEAEPTAAATTPPAEKPTPSAVA